MLPQRTSIWQRDSQPTASSKPGAVQSQLLVRRLQRTGKLSLSLDEKQGRRQAGIPFGWPGKPAAPARLAVEHRVKTVMLALVALELNVQIGDLVSGGQVRDRAVVVQQETKEPVQFELLEPVRRTIRAWLERRGGMLSDFVFPSRNDYTGHISTGQYARLVHEWVAGIGLERKQHGTHSLRRTKASIIYKATGNLRAVQMATPCS